MAYVMSIRAQTGGGSGSTIGSATEDFVQTEAFSEGLELVLSPPAGATILEGTLIVNMNEKILVRGDDYDYTFDGTDTITILFGDDVASGDIIFQVSYAYTI
jgi:hypothetical protein